jgi:lipid-A-disaccharide synthase
MRGAGVRAVVDASSLGVVGLVEVIAHIPRIWVEFRRLTQAARMERPDLAILTDSPDFHLRLAPRLSQAGIPVVYLVAPQAWAWRTGRVRTIRRHVRRLLCIFPFEEEFFARHNVSARYIGHPLSRLVRPRLGREEFLRKHRLPANRPLVTLLPGSRPGEIARHLGPLADAATRIHASRACSFVLAAPELTDRRPPDGRFWEPIRRTPIQLIEGETWDAIAHADLALAASGTVTVEAALLGTPMVTFYRVTPVSWLLGRLLVRVPFYSMVNLIAGRQIVPELMQNEMTGARLASAASSLLSDSSALSRMKWDLADVAARLSATEDPFEKAASMIEDLLLERTGHAT